MPKKKKSFLRLIIPAVSILLILSIQNVTFAAEQPLDDFDGNKIVAAWWASDSAAPYVYTIDFANAEQVHQGTKSMKVIFDKANDSNAYSLFAAKGCFDFKDYDYLSFWVYNDGSDLNFNLRFEDAAGGAMELGWAGLDFAATVTTAADWENLTIDLSRLTYSADLDWSAVTQIIFMAAPASTTASGTFWFDDLKLSRAPNSAPLDPFEADNFSWYGGGVFADNLSVVASEFHNDGTNLGNHSMKVTWGSKASGSWDSLDYLPDELASHDLNRIGNYPNFTLDGNNKLEAWVKSTSDNNFQILLKFMTTPTSGQDISYQTYTGAGGWQKLVWDYSEKTSAADVYQVKFMVYPGQADNGGTLYMDDINLTGGTAPLTPNPPDGLTSDAGDPDLDGNFTVSWNPVAGATNYQLQEANSENFTEANSYYPSGTSQAITKNPDTQKGTWYYRVRTNLSGNYGSYSAPLTVRIGVGVPPNVPALTDPGDIDRNGCYELTWSDESASGAMWYQVREDDDPDLSDAITFYWRGVGQFAPDDLGTSQWIGGQDPASRKQDGTYYYQVRAWTDTPENGGLPSDWSNIVDMQVILDTSPAASTLNDPGNVSPNGQYQVTWSDESASGAAWYELWEDTDPDLDDATTFFWRSVGQFAPDDLGTDQWISNKSPSTATYYYRVRAWTDIPENEGICSAWSDVESIEVNIQLVSMTFDDLIAEARNLALSPYIPPDVPDVPELDLPPDGAYPGVGLVYQEYEAITSDKFYDDSEWFALARPRGCALKDPMTVYNYDNDLSSYLLHPYIMENYDYSSPVIQPAIDPATLPEAGKVISAIRLGHKMETKTGLDYPQLFNIESSGYMRTTGFPPLKQGASYRVGAFRVGQSDIIEINCGGEFDKAYSGGETFSTPDSIANIEGGDISYNYARRTTASESFFDYTLSELNGMRFTPGNYDVILGFAEIEHSASGLRKFNVYIEGTQVLSDYDIFAEVGHDHAVEKTFTVAVNDGQLNIRTEDSSAGKAMVNYIEIDENPPVDRSEGFPKIKKMYTRVIDADTMNALYLIDSEAYTVAVSADFSAGENSDMHITAKFFPRDNLVAADEIAFIAFSSLFYHGDSFLEDEAHDSDIAVVKYSDGKVIEYSIKNPSYIGVETITDFTRAGTEPVELRLEQQDRNPDHYLGWEEGDYYNRCSYSVKMIQNSIPLTIKLREWYTNFEGFDNIAVTFDSTQDILKATETSEPITVEYIMSAYAAIIDYEDFEDSDLAPRDTSLTWQGLDGAMGQGVSPVYNFSITADPSPDYTGDQALKIDYYKRDKYNFLVASIDSETPRRDFTTNNTVIVWVYGQADVLLKLEDSDNISQDIGIKTAANPNSWNKLLFNYSHLTNSLKDISKILFCVEPDSGSASGTIYLDDIGITTTPVEDALAPDEKDVDNFDGLDIVGSWWDLTPPPEGPYTRDITNTEEVHSGTESMKVIYNKETGEEWEYFGAGVSYPHGDFTPYKQISFWVLGEVDILVKLRDQSDGEMEIGTISSAGGTWQKLLTADFSKLAAQDAAYFENVRAALFPNFTGTAAEFFADNTVDLTKIKDILFFVAPAVANVSGVFWLDDIQLIAKDDTTPPSVISDLVATIGIHNGEVDLAWTAPGDDDDVGMASRYVIKYNTIAIDDSNWDSSFDAGDEPQPKSAGTPESLTMTGLIGGQSYYFAIKAEDEIPNSSLISNLADAQAKRTLPTTVEISNAAWKIGIGEELANPGTSGFKDYGYWNGVPMGGFSGGAIQRSFNGDFNLWYLDVGMEKAETVPANQFSVFMKSESVSAVSQVLWNWHPSDSYEGTLSSWNWDYPKESGTYYALYPKAWTVYTHADFPVRLACEQFSPIIPDNYEETSLPVGVFKWTAENPTNENVTVSVMLTWENMVGWDYNESVDRWNNSEGNYNFAVTEGDITGIVLSSNTASPVSEELEGQFAIVAKQVPGVTISYKTTFNANGDGSDVWNEFSDDGILNNTNDQPVAGASDDYGAAVAVTFTLTPGQSITFPMVVAWDFPIMKFGEDAWYSGDTPTYWYQYYTKVIEDKGWTADGKTGKNAWVIAKQALNNYQTWETQIDTWQAPYLNSDEPDWYKASLLNQLYYMVMGGTAWENGLVPGQTGKYDDPNDYKFSLLENVDWKNYLPVDVRFYGSFPIVMLWPQLEKEVLKTISDAIYTTDPNLPPDLDGATPHDFHDPRYVPWLKYNIHQGNGGIPTTDWKDLPSHFTLMVYRYYVLTGKTDTELINYCWQSVKETLTRLRTFDTDGDGLPNNIGTDTTYDTWEQHGASSYVGGLLLAALRAAQEMADIVGDSAAKQEFTDWFDLAQPNFESKLWNGEYYKYDTEGWASDDIMADQLSGQLLARVLELPNIVPNDHIISALNKIYDYNIMGIANGERGAMNGVMPDGSIDQRAQQSQEVWTGVTYALAALMIYEGMEDEALQAAWGIYHTAYEDKGYWFRVPEAWYVDGDFRGGIYYRPMAIWAMQLAYENTVSQDTIAPAAITNLTASSGDANWDERADIDGNGVVTGLDFSILRGAYGSVPGDANWDERADIDGNGVVTGLDFSILRGAYGSVAGGPHGTVQLTWTATGDDGDVGSAGTYIIKYSDSPITSEADWAVATDVIGEPLPKVAGTPESFTVTGLTAGGNYCFAIRAEDEAMNLSGPSNTPCAAATNDTAAPEAVTDLTAETGGDYGYINLTWTAPGDDGDVGTAASYIIKYSSSAITTEIAWNEAADVTGEPTPVAAGTTQNMTVIDLIGGQTYYFAIKALDEADNISSISNSPSAAAGLACDKMFDNFDGQAIVSSWWDNVAPPAGPYLRDPADTTHAHDGTKAMKIVYSKNPGQEWEFFGAGLIDANQNLQGYSHITLWVYGNIDIMVKLRDTSSDEAEIGWLSTSTPETDDWEKLSTNSFSGLTTVDLTNIEDVLFFVEPGIADISGTFWMDEIELAANLDSTPPAAITDLAAASGTHCGQINLTWTAPGDDGDVGTAASYIIKYSSSAITTEIAWNEATDVTGEPIPVAAGTTQNMTVTDLVGGQTYCFAIKTQDELLNTSGLSNSPSAVAPTVSEKMFDDFDGNTIVDTWWDNLAPPAGPYSRDPADTTHAHDGTMAMKVVYDKEAGQEWEFFAAAPYVNERDFTPYSRLSFWIYGNIDILVKLRDINSDEAEIGTLSTATTALDDWEELISLDFSGITGVDRANITDVLFFVRPELSGVSGTFWLDEIRLTSAPTVNRAPSVTVISPNGGEVWWGTHDIIWQAQDPDAGDSITDIIIQYTEGATTNQVLVEDFNDAQDNPNDAGGAASVWTESGGIIAEAFNNDSNITYRAVGYSKELTYDVTAGASEAGYWLGLNGRDLRDYEDLTFHIRGVTGGEVLKVGLKDSTALNTEKKLLITDYLSGGVGTDWKQVTIPLVDFINVDETQVDNISFTFLNELGAPVSGTVYIDEVRFLKWVNIATGEANDGVYSWNTAGYPSGKRYLIKVSAFDGELTGKDECDDYFCPIGPDVTVISPNGDEILIGDSVISWTATYGDPIDSISIQYSTASSRKMVDDFDDGADPNLLGGGLGTWTKSDGAITSFYDSVNYRGISGYGYQINYDVSTPDDEAGFWTGLNNQDMSQYQKVSFWIKGAVGEEMLKVGLKDSVGNETKLLLNDYLPEGKVTTFWQHVVVPLPDFFTVTNWSAMENLSLTFHSAYGSPYSGAIYIDDIRFARWTDIVTGLANTGYYTWNTTTALDSDTYLIRVIAYSQDVSGQDESDAEFTLQNGAD